MKRLMYVLIVIGMSGQGVTAQNCTLDLKDGSTVTMTTHVWTNALIGDIKFLNANEEKKEQKIEEYNQTILQGKTLPKNYEFKYKIVKDTARVWNRFISTTNIAGKDYSSYIICMGDTVYIMRSKGSVPFELNGEVMGFTIQGAEKIPVNIKVGDSLPKYEDIGMMYPKTITKTVKEQISDGLRTTSTIESGPYIDKSTAEAGNGMYLKTTTSEVFHTVDAKVRETMTCSSYSTNNINAYCSRTEEVTVNGKRYTAFVIESETWGKTTSNATYEAEHQSLANAQKRLHEKMQRKQEKGMKKWGLINEDGYMVLYKDEWFVPTLGVVKVRNYDMYGAISNETTVDTIQ